MGCLNDSDKWLHWFGNIHLSGPCNRRCFFCIGQHMMALDSFNTLDTWPLQNIDSFVEHCRIYDIDQVYLTGTNTEPLQYKHIPKLANVLRSEEIALGIRTNATKNVSLLRHFNKGSITVCFVDYAKNMWAMGGPPPDLSEAAHYADLSQYKINMVLTSRTKMRDVKDMVELAKHWGITRINLREPYGQPHVGNPLGWKDGTILQGTVPYGEIDDVVLFYWDVHVVGVRSVNLYANGRVSNTYPITKGHVENGIVESQGHFEREERHRKQWIQ